MKQDKLTKHTADPVVPPDISKLIEAKKVSKKSTRFIDIDLGDFKTHALWPILVETAQRNPLYAGLVGYTRDVVLPKDPDIGVKKLAHKLSISLGEALVILDSMRSKT
ncbi:MAG: hypothetical protein ACW97A_01385 [Candidatus Thorarchaeota archaeon]